LQARKVANIESVTPDVIAAGNIGCMIQIGAATDIPVLHTIELVDWATGGEVPVTLADRLARVGQKRSPEDFIAGAAA